jgi:hypothetical protein
MMWVWISIIIPALLWMLGWLAWTGFNLSGWFDARRAWEKTRSSALPARTWGSQVWKNSHSDKQLWITRSLSGNYAVTFVHGFALASDPNGAHYSLHEQSEKHVRELINEHHLSLVE